MEKLTLLQKIQKAKSFIKESKPKKDGTNTYSNYDYFTPEIVGKLVNDVCEKFQMTTIFSLKRNEFGVYGQLDICDLEGGESIGYIMATEKPVIKATNETQQMGGCQTYTKRYMLSSAFDIEDNNSDFDSQDNRPKQKEEKKETEWLKKEQFEAAMLSDKKGILATLNAYNGTTGKQMSKEYKEKLTSKLSTAI